eukprot:732421-Prymnesium_polylepis.2
MVTFCSQETLAGRNPDKFMPGWTCEESSGLLCTAHPRRERDPCRPCAPWQLEPRDYNHIR